MDDVISFTPSESPATNWSSTSAVGTITSLMFQILWSSWSIYSKMADEAVLQELLNSSYVRKKLTG